MKSSKRKISFLLICIIFITLNLTLFVGFGSNVDTQKVIIKSMSAVYNEDSSIVVKNGKTTFNDKDQEVKYKVVLENTQNYPVKLDNIELSIPTEDFLEYEVKNIKKDDVIDSKKTKEIVVSFITKKKDGWGRNFNDKLNANLTFIRTSNNFGSVDNSTDEIQQEDTTITEGELINKVEVEQNIDIPAYNYIEAEQKNDWGFLILFLIILDIELTVTLMILIKNKNGKVVAVLLIGLCSSVALVNADELIKVPITFNIAYESQNIMKPSGWDMNDNRTFNSVGREYWYNAGQITKIYIENEFIKLPEVAYEYDVSKDKNGRVKAYLVENDSPKDCFILAEVGSSTPCYDLHIQSDGIIYANENASFYFAFMFFLEEINNLEGLDTSKVTNMRGMFIGLSGEDAETNLKLDLSSLNTSNVTNMSHMFNEYGWKSLEPVSLDISSFDTSKVTDMSYMFSRLSYGSHTVNLDLSNLDTSKVVNMNNMFEQAQINGTILISNPNTTSYSKMFNLASINADSKLIMNYTPQTSELVDLMIATKSSNSKVVKGVQVK